MNYSRAPVSFEDERKILTKILADEDPNEFLKNYKIPKIKENPLFPYGSVYKGAYEFKSVVDDPQDEIAPKLTYNLPPRAYWNICSGRPATASTGRPPRNEEEARIELLGTISTPEGAGAVVDFPLSSPKLEKVRRLRPRYKLQSEKNGDIPDSDDDDDEPLKSFSDDDSGNGRTPPHWYQVRSPDPPTSHRQSHLSDSGASSVENNESDNLCVVPSPEMKLIWRMKIRLETQRTRGGEETPYATVLDYVFDDEGLITPNPVPPIPSPENGNEDTESEIDEANLDIDSNDSSEMSVDPPEDILTIMIDEYEMEF